jgi:hypothetical protein
MLAKGVGVPRGLLESALAVKVGTTVGRFAIASPQLAQELTELTEDPRFKDLPIIMINVERTGDESWIIHVGMREFIVKDKATMDQIISGEYPIEDETNQPPSQN